MVPDILIPQGPALSKTMSQPESSSPSTSRMWLLMLAALGVVFGDIGTSPLYAMKECFIDSHSDGTMEKVVTVDRFHVMGVMSLMIWTLVLMITVQYVGLVMRADR